MIVALEVLLAVLVFDIVAPIEHQLGVNDAVHLFHEAGGELAELSVVASCVSAVKIADQCKDEVHGSLRIPKKLAMPLRRGPPRASVTACSGFLLARCWCSAWWPSAWSAPATCRLSCGRPASSSTASARWPWTFGPRAASTRFWMPRGSGRRSTTSNGLHRARYRPMSFRPMSSPIESESTPASAATVTAPFPRTSSRMCRVPSRRFWVPHLGRASPSYRPDRSLRPRLPFPPSRILSRRRTVPATKADPRCACTPTRSECTYAEPFAHSRQGQSSPGHVATQSGLGPTAHSSTA